MYAWISGGLSRASQLKAKSLGGKPEVIVKYELVNLLDRYKDQAIVRGLVQLIPLGLGSAIDTAVTIKFATYQEQRLRAFFDELANGKVQLVPELVEQEDFLHAFSATTRAVVRTRREQKIKILARLLGGAWTEAGPESIDEYEELLGIIDELSFREMRILSLLSKHEKQAVFGELDNDLQRANKVWPPFEEEVETLLGIPPVALAPILVRLQRSGCYAELTGGYWDYMGGRGHLTHLFRRLKTVVGGLEELAT